MSFCIFCGKDLRGGGEKAQEQVSVYELYEACKYDEILMRAVSGDVTAQCYYMAYIDKLMEKSMMFAYEEELSLLRKMTNTSTFAEAAYAIFRYGFGKKSFMGINNVELMESGAKAIINVVAKKEDVALVTYAHWLLNGNDYVVKNEMKAYQYMKEAADNNYPEAIYWLGMWYRTGSAGLAKDEQKGYELIEKAALLGEPRAKSKLDIYGKNQEDDMLDDLEENVEQIKKLLSVKEQALDNQSYFNIGVDKSQWDSCKNPTDYHRLSTGLYKYSKKVQNWIKLSLNVLTGITFDDYGQMGKWIEDRKKAQQMIDSYQSLTQFLRLEDDLRNQQIKLNEENKKVIWEYASNRINSDYREEIKLYEKYQSESNEYQGGFAALLLLVIFFVGICSIVYYFHRRSGLVLFAATGVITVWAILILFKRKREIKKLKRSDGYLINDIIQYGYVVYKTK